MSACGLHLSETSSILFSSSPFPSLSLSLLFPRRPMCCCGDCVHACEVVTLPTLSMDGAVAADPGGPMCSSASVGGGDHRHSRLSSPTTPWRGPCRCYAPCHWHWLLPPAIALDPISSILSPSVYHWVWAEFEIPK